MAVVGHVQALMCESRMREMKRLNKFIHKHGIEAGDKDLKNYVQERIAATRKMSKVIEEFAIKAEGKRPWKSTQEHKHKHHHHSHKSKHRSKH
jgi:hypothetical protein